MTDKELKHMLKNAYELPESGGSQRFIKEHEKRSRQLSDVIKNEFYYMGIKSILAGFILCGLFMAVALNGEENMMWITSSMLPVCSLIPLIPILRSGKYGMCELEAASRFSLKFIQLIRMFILGIFSSVVILGGSVLLRKIWICGMLDIVIYMLLPYFVSIWGSLFIARKWHGKESAIGVPFICIATGFLPTTIRELRNVHITPDYMYVILTVIIMVASVKECIEFINERSDLSWNLY